MAFLVQRSCEWLLCLWAMSEALEGRVPSSSVRESVRRQEGDTKASDHAKPCDALLSTVLALADDAKRRSS